MKQIQLSQFGQPSVVAKCVEVADVGAPSAWEVVVDIEAFPINVADLAMMAGRYGTLPKLPSTIGMEAVGVVQQCGSAVTNLQVGDRVVLLANNNWAERRKVPATTVHKVPGNIDPVQLSMLKVNPATALLILENFGNLQTGDWVLQTAPLGSVGQCVIQLAKCKGFKTVNIVRTDEARQKVLALGGDVAVVSNESMASELKSSIAGDSIRLAMDAVAGPGTSQLADCLSDGGTIVNYGMLSAEPCVIKPEHTIFHNISLVGFWLSKTLNRLRLDQRVQLFDSLCSYLHNSSLKMSVDSTFPIESIGDALRRAEQGGRNGKVIVTTHHLSSHL